MSTDLLLEKPTAEPVRNYWSWLGRWGTATEEAVDRACRQFPAEVQGRGIARGYYEYLWVLKELQKVFPQGVAGLEVMDVGCGAGVLALALRYLGAHVTAVDRFDEYAAHCRNQMGRDGDLVARLQANGVSVERRDFVAHGLPSQGDTLDLITFFGVIEHLHGSPRQVLEDMHHLLRPGGHIAVTTPNHAWVRNRLRLLAGRSVHHALSDWWQTPFYGHIREFTQAEVGCMLRWSGFEIIKTATSSWVHAASRLRSRQPSEPDHWTTRFTLRSPERWLVACSLILTYLMPSWRYTMLIVGRKPENSPANQP